jgi:alkylhydroperoxidase/carboxymuconolactone decarboxylase family protein YurZ
MTAPKSSPPALPTPDEVRARLEGLRASRGYLLPHHGALAAAAPDLHDAYSAMYTALTLTERHLESFEKEFVWLVLLVALREAIGTHHLDLFRKAGGTDQQAQAAFRLAGYAAGAAAFSFVERHWQEWFPATDPLAAYRDGVHRLTGGSVNPGLADLALAAMHAALGQGWGVAAHIRSAYEAGVAEDKLVEALALIIWPAGVNRFVEACTIWHGLMTSGGVVPSPRYRAWAEMPGQGAFDPATEQK